MKENQLENIIAQLAKQNHTTPEIVRREMELAMEAGLKSKDPKVRARWASIPHKGETVTLEEFLAYIASILNAIS